MFLTRKERSVKLAKLAELEGFESVEALLRAATYDSVSPGICIKADCNYATEVEPDQQQGWCEVCGAQTMQSAPIFAELI